MYSMDNDYNYRVTWRLLKIYLCSKPTPVPPESLLQNTKVPKKIGLISVIDIKKDNYHNNSLPNPTFGVIIC